MFSHAYFDGVVILLSLFDFDLFWVERDGKVKNLIRSRISDFLEIKNEKIIFEFGEQREFMQKFEIFYDLMFKIYPDLVINYKLDQNFRYKQNDLFSLVNDYIATVNCDIKKEIFRFRPLFENNRRFHSIYQLYVYIFPLITKLNWVLEYKQKLFLKEIENHIERYKLSESYYSIEEAYIDFEIIKRREKRKIFVVGKMDEKEKPYINKPLIRKIEKGIEVIREEIENMEINFIGVQSRTDAINRRLSVMEDVDGTHPKINELRGELKDLIEFRRSKGNLEYPVYLPKAYEWLAKRAKKHPYEEGPSGFIID